MDDLQHKAPLAGFQGSRPPAPHWFEHALKQAPERKFIEVDGAKIDTLAWGRRGAPGLILLHGGMAHADWWSFIAPLLAGERRVVAPTFSGMGRSGWRDAYTFSQFAREACETGRAAGAFEAGPPVIVGHSFGARVAVVAAHEYHNEVASAVIVDPPFFAPENMREPNPPRPYKGHRPYETLDALVARFRLSPPQPCENAFILDHIARHSAREIVDGKGHKRWTLGFDPDFWDKTTRSDIVPMLQAALTPLALARGDKSKLFKPADARYFLSLLPPGAPHLVLPEAEHHVMIDQPLAFVAMLQTLLQTWPPARSPSPVRERGQG